MFYVEATQYGWSVRAGIEQLGLFVTQRQALQDVKRRRAELARQDEHSTLVVKGGDETPDGGRSSRPGRPYRQAR
jgi:hypothetical protein